MIVNNALLHVLQIPGEFEKIATGDRFFIIAKNEACRYRTNEPAALIMALPA
jgi:hypothetical protein